MKVIEESSKIVKPFCESDDSSITTTQQVGLSVFDLIADDAHIPLIYAYKPPTPSNEALELGLRKVLSEYREFAGRFGVNSKGERVILVNDEGVKVVEASASCTLDQAMLVKPTPSLFKLHQAFIGVKELVLIQLTRFTCGSLVVGVSTHHMVADGRYASQFLVAWGRACRGLDNKRALLLDRQIFVPRDPPQLEFEHRGVEFKSKAEDCYPKYREDLVMNKFRFDANLVLQIKSEASWCLDSNMSKFESLMAHVWRAAARACEKQDGYKWTRLKIAVHGLTRLNPKVPNDYFGNLVLWAYPRAQVKELVKQPLSYAAKIIHEAVSKVKDNYFKSFIDFACCKAGEEGLVPKTHLSDDACLNFYVDSWLGFPFCHLDFGCGKPHIFTPTYQPWEGQLYVVPSIDDDEGSIDVFLSLNPNQMDSFKTVCYSFLADSIL